MVAHSEVLLSKCAQFRDDGQFIDVRLKVHEDIFPAHRVVLAANSDYFHAMFTDGMKESNQEVIELKDESISADALKIVMDSIYTGDLRVNEENVFEVLAAADHLQVKSAVKLCCDFLLSQCIQRRFDIETYCHVWRIADRHGLRDLQEAAEHGMASKFKDVCESEEFLTNIGAEQLFSLISRDDLAAPSETFVFKSVMQWIKHKKEERMSVAVRVIGAVRLGLVDIKVLTEELGTEEMQRTPKIAMQLLEVLLYNNSPSHNCSVEKVKPRLMKQVLVAILPQTQMQYFDDETKTWKPLPSIAQLTEATECCCAEYVGNYLYVAAKKANEFVNYRYDTVSNLWETLPPVLSHSDYCNNQIDSLCFLDEYLYAISGGSTCVPFRYSPAKNNWQGGASLDFVKKQFDDPKNKLTNATATVWNSHLYVLHNLKTAEEIVGFASGRLSSTFTGGTAFGATSAQSAAPTGLFGTPSLARAAPGSLFGAVSAQSEVPTQVSLLGTPSSAPAENTCQAAILHCFNPETNRWKQLSSTCRPHCDSCLFVINNKLYVVGRSGSFLSTSASVELYDEENNTWSVVEQKHIPLNKLGAVEIEGRVCFMVNKCLVDVGIRIPPGEVYQICLNDWKNLAQINKEAVLCYMPVRTDSLNAE